MRRQGAKPDRERERESLQNLTFGDGLNQSLEQVSLPNSLQTLILGDYFNKSLERVTLPDSLQNLTVGKYVVIRVWHACPFMRFEHVALQ